MLSRDGGQRDDAPDGREGSRVAQAQASETGKQQAKSRRARDAICEATITCLIERGYGETSLNRVADMAGLSKGALQHHFPTKEDLIAATAERLLSRTANPSDEGADSVEEVLRQQWRRMMNTGPYRALLEILVAARTDRELQARVSENLLAWGEAHDRQSVERFRSVGRDDADVKILTTLTRSVMRGLIIQDRYSADPGEAEASLERWIELVAPLLELRRRET